MIIARGLFKVDLPRFAGRVGLRSFCSDDDFKKQTKVQITNENAQ